MKNLNVILLVSILYLSLAGSVIAKEKELTLKQKEAETVAHAMNLIDLCRSPSVEKVMKLYPCMTNEPNWMRRPNTACRVNYCNNYKAKPYENKDEVYKKCMADSTDGLITFWQERIALQTVGSGDPKASERCKSIVNYKYLNNYDSYEGAYFQLDYSRPVYGNNGNLVKSEIVSFQCLHNTNRGDCAKEYGDFVIRK
jgi:hypothetical protein